MPPPDMYFSIQLSKPQPQGIKGKLYFLYKNAGKSEFNNVESLQNGEQNLNINWVFVYQWGFNQILGDPELKNYIYNKLEYLII